MVDSLSYMYLYVYSWLIIVVDIELWFRGIVNI